MVNHNLNFLYLPLECTAHEKNSDVPLLLKGASN